MGESEQIASHEFEPLFHAGGKKADFFIASAGQSQYFAEATGRKVGEQGFQMGVKAEGFFQGKFFDELDVGGRITDLPDRGFPGLMAGRFFQKGHSPWRATGGRTVLSSKVDLPEPLGPRIA